MWRGADARFGYGTLREEMKRAYEICLRSGHSIGFANFFINEYKNVWNVEKNNLQALFPSVCIPVCLDSNAMIKQKSEVLESWSQNICIVFPISSFRTFGSKMQKLSTIYVYEWVFYLLINKVFILKNSCFFCLLSY